MPFDPAASEAEEEPPSRSGTYLDVFDSVDSLDALEPSESPDASGSSWDSGSYSGLRPTDLRRVRSASRASLAAQQRTFIVAVILLGAAISAPLAFIRCTGGLGLNVLYMWPAMLAFSIPAIMMFREARRIESLWGRVPLTVRGRRGQAGPGRSVACLNEMRRGRVDRHA